MEETVDNAKKYVYGVDYEFLPNKKVNFPIVNILSGQFAGVQSYCIGLKFPEDMSAEECHITMDIEFEDTNGFVIDHILHNEEYIALMGEVVNQMILNYIEKN